MRRLLMSVGPLCRQSSRYYNYLHICVYSVFARCTFMLFIIIIINNFNVFLLFYMYAYNLIEYICCCFINVLIA